MRKKYANKARHNDYSLIYAKCRTKLVLIIQNV